MHLGIAGVVRIVTVVRDEIAIEVDVVLVRAVQSQEPVRIERVHEHEPHVVTEYAGQVAVEQPELDAGTAETFDTMRAGDDDQTRRASRRPKLATSVATMRPSLPGRRVP